MEKVVRVFNSFEEAEASDIEEDLAVPPERRIEILLELQARIYPNAAAQRFARVYCVTELERD